MVAWWDVRRHSSCNSSVPPAAGLLAHHLPLPLPTATPLQVPDMVDAALREADADHDGQVDLQDFKTFLASKTDDSLSLFDSRVSRDGSDSSGSDAN